MALSRLRSLPVLAAALVVSIPAGAFAQVASGPPRIAAANDRVGELDRSIARAERDLEQVEADLEGLDEELRAANDALAQADARARRAQAAAEEAQADVDRTRRELAEAELALADHQTRLATVVRDAYMFGPQTASAGVAAIEQIASGRSAAELGDTLHVLGVVLGQRGQMVSESTRLLSVADELTTRARAAETRSGAEAEAAQAALDEAAARHAEVMAIVDRADAAVREQTQLLSGLRAERAQAVRDAETKRAERERATREAADAVVARSVGGGLVSVGGITVAASLAPDLEALLEAARADGIVLGGSGYRSPETTARLRLANGCPDVYTSPASSCRVPTARPGTSMHEQGLAIDFTYQGRTICYPNRASSCRGNPAFDWLAANARRFGLYVLASEAWHWSTNGE